MPLAPSWVGGGVGVFPLFWGSLFTLVSPLFQHATTAGCFEPEAAQFGCPKDGPYWPLFEESGCGRLWVPCEVPWGFWGIPCWAGLPPPCPWFLLGISGGFDFWALLGCGWPACPMCIRHTVGLEHSCSLPRWGPGRSIGGSNPCFQHG